MSTLSFKSNSGWGTFPEATFGIHPFGDFFVSKFQNSKLIKQIAFTFLHIVCFNQ